MALNTKQGWNWIASHFGSGNNAWITFSGGTAQFVSSAIDFSVSNNESGSSFSDDNGNLLLVSDGTTIKTSGGTNIVTGLSGSAFSMQAATILQSPYSSDTYYIFTLGVGAALTEGGYGDTNQALTYNTLKYTGGTSPFFQVINYNVEIGDRNISGGSATYPIVAGGAGYGYAEVLTTALHENETDIWVITPNWGRNQIHSFLITASGVSSTPFTSTTSQVLQGHNNYGQIKPSPDYSKIAMVLADSNAVPSQSANRPAVSIFDFNRTTGALTNETVLLGSTGYTIYDKTGSNPEIFDIGDVIGCEFSPDGNYLYVSEFQNSNGGKVLQFNLNTTPPVSASTVTASTNYVMFYQTSGSSIGTLHLAVDEKIYFTDRNTRNLYYINYPNLSVSSASFTVSSMTSDVSTATFNYGLPNIPLFANIPTVITGCSNTDYCFYSTNPTLSTYNGTYLKYGIYGGKDVYSSATYTVFWKINKWCLSTSLGGDCLVFGPSPCSSDCPNLNSNIWTVGTCNIPTPTPTPSSQNTNFNVFFNCNVLLTPSVTPTNTQTPTMTPSVTPTITPTNPCGGNSFSLSVSTVQNTPTPTPSPTSTPAPTKVPVSGSATYYIVDSNFICGGLVAELLDCSDSSTTYLVGDPLLYNGVLLTPGSVFEGVINGVTKCLSFNTYKNGSSDVLFGGIVSTATTCHQCLFFPTPTPTKTPTPTVTPTITVTPTTSLPAIGVLSLSSTNDTCESYTLSARTANRFFGTISVIGSGATGSNYRYSINSGSTVSSTTLFSGLSSSTYGVVVKDNSTGAQTSVTPVTITRPNSGNTFSAITFTWSQTPVFVSSAATAYSVDITGTTYPGSAITFVYSGTATLGGLSNIPSGVTWNGSFNDQWGMNFNTQTGFFSGMTTQPWQVTANIIKNGSLVTATTRTLATTSGVNPTGGTCTDSGSTIFNQVRRASNGSYSGGFGWRTSNLAPTSVSSTGFLPFTFQSGDTLSLQLTYSGTVLSVPNLPGGCSQTLSVSTNLLSAYFSTASNVPTNNNIYISSSGQCFTINGTRTISSASQVFLTYTVT